MLVKTFSASVQGLQASAVTVEVNATRGIRFVLVGRAGDDRKRLSRMLRTEVEIKVMKTKKAGHSKHPT